MRVLREVGTICKQPIRRYSPLPIDPLARFKNISQKIKAPRVLITGSLGQLGRGLNSVYKYMYGNHCVVMSDIVRLPTEDADVCELLEFIRLDNCVFRFLIK